MKWRLFAFVTLLLAFSTFAAHSGDYRKGSEAYQRGDYKIALIEFRDLAAEGSATAQYNLGLMYEQGLGVPKDMAKAEEWYLRAADQGKPEAEYRIGLMLESRIDGTRDLKSARVWFRSAAEKGVAAAQFRIGSAYHLAQGEARDDTEAKKWLLRAANQNFTDAQVMLGEMLFFIRIPFHKNARAYKWMSIAASAGSETAKKKIRFFSLFMTPNQIVEGRRLIREWRVKFDEKANQD